MGAVSRSHREDVPQWLSWRHRDGRSSVSRTTRAGSAARPCATFPARINKEGMYPELTSTCP